MGNWLENLMNKMNEEERQKRAEAESRAYLLAQEKAKKEDIARVEREAEMLKRGEIRDGLRNILVKYKVPYLLKDVKDTVWKKGEIVEESYVTKDGFAWLAIGLVDERSVIRSEQTISIGGYGSRKEYAYRYVDAVIIGVSVRSILRDSLYFKSGIIFERGVLYRSSQFSPSDREKIKYEFGTPLATDRSRAMFSTVSITGKSDTDVITELQNLLAKDSFNRRQYGRLPKRFLG